MQSQSGLDELKNIMCCLVSAGLWDRVVQQARERQREQDRER